MDDMTENNAQADDPIAAMAAAEAIRANEESAASDARNAIADSEAFERSELVKEQNRKKTTVIFMIAATLVELVLSLLCIAVLYLGAGVVIYRVIGATNPALLQLSSPVIFIAGMVVGYKIYKRIMRHVIDKAGLKDRLNPDVYDQYLTRKERLAKRYTR